MPLVTSNQGVDVPFTGNADKLVAESNRVVKELDQIKEHSKRLAAESVRHAKVMEDAAKKQTTSWTEFRSMYSTVLDVVRVGQAVWQEVGQKSVDNAVLVGNFARSLGTTTEEASRLKEVADDVGISTDALRTSLKLAQKDGFEPNIEGLARMADEYNALAPGVERTQYLLDRFGKSGEEMGKLLERGGDGIRNMSAAMDEGLIVTEQAYEQARKYQISVDALKDSWDALTYKAAPPLIQAVTDVTNGYRVAFRAREIMEEQGVSMNLLNIEQIATITDLAAAEIAQADATLLAKESSEEATGAFASEAEQAAALKEEAKLAEQAIKDMTDANKGYVDQIEKVTSINDSYTEGVADANKALADGKITMEEHKTKLDELAAKREDATKRMMLNMLELQLAEGGFTAAERDALIQQGVQWGVYSETAIADMAAAQAKVDELTARYASIPPLVETHVNTYQNTYYGQYNSGATQYPHAAGGSFMIPQSYGNEGMPIGRGGDTASGGERLTITPAGQEVVDYKKMARAIRDALAAAGG